MGAVIPFRRREEPRLSSQEQLLQDRLRGSLQAMWRGGWISPGEFGGVALQRHQRFLGLWSFEDGEYVYRPIEIGQVTHRAASVDIALEQTLELLGPLPPLP